MAYNREGYAPWSLTRKAGVQSATVDGTIEVPQYIQPVLDTGFVDEKGDWKGTKSSDELFHAFDKHVGIPNSGEILTPQAINDTTWPIDMTGFSDIIVAIKPTNGGDVSVSAVMGPDTNSYANLSPIKPASDLLGNYGQSAPNDLTTLFVENAIGVSADVWNLWYIERNLKNQKLLQFKITNTNLGESDFEIAFMRLV